MATVHIRYVDVGEQGPRLGCGLKTEYRTVRNIVPVTGGGEKGVIRYKGRDVQVYRRDSDTRIWTTDWGVLGPIKVTKVF
jgi:hypothetical protein